MWRLSLRLVVLAISITLGLKATPQLAPPVGTLPVACSVVASTIDEALQVGHRLEPKISAPILLDRQPTSPPVLSIASRTDEGHLASTRPSDDREDIPRLPKVKHIPRMECGEPPRAELAS